jgi:hypothetical protein
MGIERPWFGAATELRVIVCGGRFFRDVPLIWRTLDRINAECRISPLIDGASDDVTGPYVGADYWAHQWALAHDVSTIRQRAEWKKLGRAAGPIRNQIMLDRHGPDLVIAFPGHNGTANMVGIARKAGVRVFEIDGP